MLDTCKPSEAELAQERNLLLAARKERGAVAQAFLIVGLRQVRHAEITGEDVGPGWCRVIRNAVLLLYAEAFWEAFHTDCQSRYKVSVDGAEIEALRERLRRFLKERLPITSTSGIALHVELAAAEAMQCLGGMPLPVGEAPLVCGPEMIRLLGYEAKLAAFVRQMTHVPVPFERSMELEDIVRERIETPVLDPVAALQLRRCFSRLGEAQALLEGGDPQEALVALRESACSVCSSCYAHEAEDEELRVCAQNCPRFASDNPAYAALDDGAEWFRRDGLELAAEAQLALATSALCASPIDVELAQSHWRMAMSLSRRAFCEDRMRERLAETALGRAKVLKSRGRLDDAVQLLERTAEIEPDFASEGLVGELADLLHQRGIKAANRSEPDWEAAIKDLHQSVALSAGPPKKICNLVIARQNAAIKCMERNSALSAEHLYEARRALEAGSERFPHQTDLIERKMSLDQQILALTQKLNDEGVTAGNTKNFERGVELLEWAYRLSPTVTHVVDSLCKVSMGQLCELILRHENDRARMVFEGMKRRFPKHSATKTAELLIEP